MTVDTEISEALNIAASCANNLTEPMNPTAQRAEVERLWHAINWLRTLTMGSHDGQYPVRPQEWAG